MAPTSVAIALGSNLGNRRVFIRRAMYELSRFVSIVRVSSLWETEPVAAPPGSPRFLNAVIAGHTRLAAEDLLTRLLEIETRLGRRRRHRNEPRVIDLDLIFYDATLLRSRRLTLPHPRYREREFVMGPLRELDLPWVDPQNGMAIGRGA